MKLLALAALVAVGAVAALPAPAALAQAKPAAKPAAAPSAAATPAPAAQSAPQAAPQPWRTEIVVYDSWTTTCQEFREPKPQKLCNARMQIVREGTQQQVLTVVVAADDKGQMRAAFATPTGVAIAPGVDVVIGGAPARKATFESCDQSRCLASLAADDKFIKDLIGASDVEAAVITSTGQPVKLGFASKGFDKAWAHLNGK